MYQLFRVDVIYVICIDFFVEIGKYFNVFNDFEVFVFFGVDCKGSIKYQCFGQSCYYGYMFIYI